MSEDWIYKSLSDVASKILELTSLQIGLDFTDLRELSRIITSNRYGFNAILELQLIGPSSQTYTIGLIIKQVYADRDYFKYVVSTAEKFQNLLESRQAQWDEQKRLISTNEVKKFNWPEMIYSPKIWQQESDKFLLLFEILPRFISRPKSGVSPDARYSLAGYALARMHGFSEPRMVSVDYSEWLPFLFSLDINKQVIYKWKDILDSSRGGIDFGFGEFTLDSIQYNALVPGKGHLDSLCLIDPILVTGADRCDDLGYLVYSIAEKFVDNAISKAIPEEGLTRNILKRTLDHLMTKSVPRIIQAYTAIYPSFKSLYNSNLIPIDFFAGVYLLSKAQNLEEGRNRAILSVLGQQFIENAPISEMIFN